jgi:quinol-cytochrome oxidoreductase complex cytochrome b subunit
MAMSARTMPKFQSPHLVRWLFFVVHNINMMLEAVPGRIEPVPRMVVAGLVAATPIPLKGRKS